jgi:hypothetical protein
MQVGPQTSPNSFWQTVIKFLCRVGGGDELARAIAVTTVADVVSDVLFHNVDAPSRTDDPQLLGQIARVLEELRAMDMAALASR